MADALLESHRSGMLVCLLLKMIPLNQNGRLPLRLRSNEDQFPDVWSVPAPVPAGGPSPGFVADQSEWFRSRAQRGLKGCECDRAEVSVRGRCHLLAGK